jgi:hypothetical protein
MSVLKRAWCLIIHFNKPNDRNFKAGTLTCSKCGLDWDDRRNG